MPFHNNRRWRRQFIYPEMFFRARYKAAPLATSEAENRAESCLDSLRESRSANIQIRRRLEDHQKTHRAPHRSQFRNFGRPFEKTQIPVRARHNVIVPRQASIEYLPD
jgi:hypothetical protein